MEYEHWKNKKTGVIYTVIDEAQQLVFVREKTEFYAKFEKVSK